jgi:hypothetical protein
LIQKLSLKRWTGETKMAKIISPGTRTNIFLSTADLAGLKEQHHQLPIDSTLNSTTNSKLQLLSVLKLQSTAKEEEIVQVESQIQFMNLPLLMAFLMLHVNNMMLTTLEETKTHVNQLMSAETAPGLHAHQGKDALTNAGLLNTRSTTSVNIMEFVAMNK